MCFKRIFLVFISSLFFFGAFSQANDSIEARHHAVQLTIANNVQCNNLDIFYWEIGDKNGKLASGWGGKKQPANATSLQAEGIGAQSAMRIASASKWLFGAYALQREGYDNISQQSITIDGHTIAKKRFLNFTSGYDNERRRLCKEYSVGDCVTRKGKKFNADSAEHYSYDGGHMQMYAIHGLGLADYVDNDIKVNKSDKPAPLLATEIKRFIGEYPTFVYQSPNVAGGAAMSPRDYAQFLQKILNNQLAISKYLGADAVCAWVDPTKKTCDAVQTPITGNGAGIHWEKEQWHYSYGHWVETDPKVGDGAFSSPGAFGFYPWINADKNLYGILARNEPVIKRPALGSVSCGRLLRKAWEAGQEQKGLTP